MSETININFKMNINNDGQTYTIQFDDLGKRYIRNDKTFIKLKEPLIDEDTYNNLMLICQPNEITIIRNGIVQMRQSYIKDEVTIGSYKNKYISSEIRTFTNQYRFTSDQIILNYDVLVDEDVVGNYQMEVQIKGVEGHE